MLEVGKQYKLHRTVKEIYHCHDMIVIESLQDKYILSIDGSPTAVQVYTLNNLIKQRKWIVIPFVQLPDNLFTVE